MKIETESVESGGEQAVTAESEHVENLTAEEFDRELIRRIAEVEDLSPAHVASRKSVVIDMNNLHVSADDF